MKRAASAFLLFAFLCSGALAGPRPKISADTTALVNSASEVKVVIQWNTSVGTATTAKIVAVGGIVIKEFSSLRQGFYEVPSASVTTLGNDPAVKYITIDRQVKRKLALTTGAINAPAVWQMGFYGSGVGVAVLDSGVNADPNLGSGAIAFSDDFTPSAYDSNGKMTKSFGLDWYGHGQHIAGIIASNGKSSSCKTCTPVIGVAPGANIIDLKVLDSQGQGSDSQVIAGIDEAIRLKTTYNIKVINLSLGRPVMESYTQDPLCQAVEAAWQAGIVVVAAAGNDGRDNSANNQGYGTILAPGNDPYVITVGSMKTMGTVDRSDDLIASYSSKGPTAIDHVVKPDLVAPGNLMVSLLAQHGTLALANPQNAVTVASIQGGSQPDKPPTAGKLPKDSTSEPPGVNFGGGYSNTYYTLSGTSMATAVVSGAVADILQAYPNLTPDQVKVILMSSSSKTFPTSSSVTDSSGNIYTSYYDMFTVGAGYLDLQAAMTAAGQSLPTGNSLSPISSYDQSSGNIYVTADAQSAWANQTVSSTRCKWGANSVWSSSVLSANQAIFGSRCIWGASADSAERCIWGANSLASASANSSESTDSAESVQVTGEN